MTQSRVDYDYGQMRAPRYVDRGKTSPLPFIGVGIGDAPPRITGKDRKVGPVVLFYCPCGEKVGGADLWDPRQRDASLPMIYVARTRRRDPDGGRWRDVHYLLDPASPTDIVPECPHHGVLDPVDQARMLGEARKAMARAKKASRVTPRRVYVTGPSTVC